MNFISLSKESVSSWKFHCRNSINLSSIGHRLWRHHIIFNLSLTPSNDENIKNILKVRIIEIEFHSNIECIFIYFKLNCLLITFGSLFIFIFISQLTRICSKSADFSWETHSLKNLGTFLNETFWLTWQMINERHVNRTKIIWWHMMGVWRHNIWVIYCMMVNVKI